MGLAITDDQRTVFAYYTSATDNRIVSMSWDGQGLGEPSVILDGIPKAGIHNGGRMVVGPDGHLYVGTGDAGDSQLAQDKSSLGGKILRLTPEGAPAPDNPFDNEVYSFGHRNVQGLAFDDDGRLWACEFGSQQWDELNLIEPGANYGWPLVEGSGSGDGLINPKVVWQTSEASPSGLAYWDGDLWMAALRGARLWQIPVSGTTTSDPIAHFEDRVRPVADSRGCPRRRQPPAHQLEHRRSRRRARRRRPAAAGDPLSAQSAPVSTRLAVLGVLIMLPGLVFAGQGLNLIPGSFMTGNRQWFYIGTAMTVVGLGLIVLGLLRRRPHR